MTGPNQPLIDRFAAPPARGKSSRVFLPSWFLVAFVLVAFVVMYVILLFGVAVSNVHDLKPENLATRAAKECANSGAGAVLLVDMYWFECEP